LSKLPADMSLFPAQRAGIEKQLKDGKIRERQQLLAEGIRQQLIKEGKLKIHKKVIDQLAASYRG